MAYGVVFQDEWNLEGVDAWVGGLLQGAAQVLDDLHVAVEEIVAFGAWSEGVNAGEDNVNPV